MGSHLTDSNPPKFKSDKYPDCPEGLIPFKPTDPMAQDLLWEYAQRRRSVDPEFSDDLETVLRLAGYVPEEEKQVEDKKKWAKSLKVGDVVCDCRYKHLKIAEIDGQESDNVYDIQLVLEDGSCCSAIHCCDPVDHEWDHSKEEGT